MGMGEIYESKSGLELEKERRFRCVKEWDNNES